jgi:HK97 family phage prohead protease
MSNFITFAANITGANEVTRQISGVVVPFGKAGNTSAGPVIFELGSITNPDPAPVKFLLQHDAQRPIGKAIEFQVTPGGITGTFKVSNTTAGSDALVEAADGLRDGLSVGAQIDNYSMKDGVMHVTAARIIEVSLVHSPAFSDAVVTDVAASETEVDAETTPDDTTEKEETNVSEQPIEEVEAAAAPVVQAAAPILTAPRSPIVDGASYLEYTIKAARGDDESRQYVMAADDTLSTNPGFNPTEYFNEVVGSAQRKFGRPTIEACGGATGHRFVGNTISIPKIGTVPTVAETAENGAPSETGITATYLTGTAKKYAGMNTFSVELLDLQGTPTFYNELMNEMVAAYAKATNAAVIAAITAGGTQASTTAASVAGLQAFASKEAVAAYAGTGNFANAYVAGASQWELLLNAADTSGRPIFNAAQPQNAGGNVSVGSSRGNVFGLDLYVDNSMVATTIDESAFIIAADSIGIYEQAPRQLQVNQINSLQIEVSLHGYLATIIKRAAGLRRFNLT